MRALLSTIGVVAMWGAACWRLHLRRAGAGERHLSTALIALAATLTIDHPAGGWAIQHLVGVPHTADVVKHLLVLLAGWASTESMRLHMHDEAVASHGRRNRTLVASTCATVLLTLFVTATWHGLPAGTLMDATATSGRLQAYWFVYTVYMAFALVGITKSMALLARYTDPSPVRTTFTLVATGSAAAVAYLLHKAAVLTLDITGAHGGWLRSTRDPLSDALIFAAVVPFVLGITWQLLARLPVVRHAAAYRSLDALYPLWRRLYEATPAVALTPPSTTTGDQDDIRPGPRDVEHCLQRRVIEIRDGALAVRPYITSSQDLAQRVALDHEVPARDVALVAEAAQLEQARRAKQAGRPPGDEPGGDAQLTATGGTDLAGEARTLRRVARHLPVVDRIADALDAHERLDAP